ncbi:MAG: AAA domain-containing protein [Nitrospiraceae bacterium]
MKLIDLLEHFSRLLAEQRDSASARGLDAPVTVSAGRRILTAGTLHLYELEVPAEAALSEDFPVTIIPTGDIEPTEGFVVGRRGRTVLVQTFEAVGQTVASATLVPDSAGFFDTASRRLAEMARKSGAYMLGPAERLVPMLDPDQSDPESQARAAIPSSVFSPVWNDDPATRRAKLTSLVIELVRANKRLLVVGRDHRTADEALGAIARAMRAAGLPFKSLLSRYELPAQLDVAGLALQDLAFETQMNRFYAKSRADKATLRRKYDRFRELTPLLAFKAEKQRDLDEVKLLEWRLLTQVSDLQAKIKDINATLAEYEALPIWNRLAMQAVGKNVGSLNEYRSIYEQSVQTILAELDVAKHRIEELSPEAAIPKDIRPEYRELKDEIKKLGGTKKIRELLAAEEATNRQAFLQTKQVVATTAARVVSDPLFARVRFDVLIVDEAPFIPAPFLLAAAGLVRERIVLLGDPRDIPVAQAWRPALATPIGRK